MIRTRGEFMLTQKQREISPIFLNTLDTLLSTLLQLTGQGRILNALYIGSAFTNVLRDASKMIDYVGKQVGHYHLVRVLGKGGFAHVYLGIHIDLHTPAALITGLIYRCRIFRGFWKAFGSM